MEKLISPYGGELPMLLTDEYRAQNLKREAMTYPSVDLDWGQLCELELLLTGALAPLGGYMCKADMEGVLSGLKLADGLFWPRPVTLAVPAKSAEGLAAGSVVALRDAEGFMPAVLHVSEVWPADPEREVELAATSGMPYNGKAGLQGKVYLAGRLEGVALPPRHDFLPQRLTPAEVRAQFARRGWRRVLAIMPGQAMHRMHQEFCLRTAAQREANLFIHVAGGSDPVLDAAHFGRIRACQALLPRFPAPTTLMAVSPLLPTANGPRETLYKAIIARNHGCSQLVVGGEIVPEGDLRRGDDLATANANATTSQVSTLAAELGVELIPFPRLVYVEDRDEYQDERQVDEGARTQSLNGAELQRRLMQGVKVPDWFTYPEVLQELVKTYPPRNRQGFTVFFTGLSGAGKSTIARALTVKLMEMGGRRVTLLDGDVVRKNLSSELGFSKAHRDINIRRIGYVASEITKHTGIAICAPIAPYRQTRRAVREAIEAWGGFIEVFVSTSVQVCESRDRKGLYAKARAGLIPEFTGVSDPYEEPENAELDIDTAQYSVDEAVQRIVLKLEQEGYLR